MESIRNMQVAEDLYDLRLTSNIFIHWYRYVCKQIVLEGHKMKIAEKHHKRYISQVLKYNYLKFDIFHFPGISYSIVFTNGDL